MKLRVVIGVLVSLAVLSPAGPAHATEAMRDRGNFVDERYEYKVVAEPMGQTFDVGYTGTLTKVELYAAPCEGRFPNGCPSVTVEVSIREVIDGDPTAGQVLGTAPATFFSAGQLGQWMEINFATPIPVEKGKVYAIEIPALPTGHSLYGRSQPLGTDLWPGQWYRVSDITDTGFDLAFWTWIVPAGTAPAPAAAPIVEYVGGQQVVVSWEPVETATVYWVIRTLPDGSGGTQVSDFMAGTSVTVDHRPGETYRYQVVAANEWGAASPAASTAFRTPSSNKTPAAKS